MTPEEYSAHCAAADANAARARLMTSNITRDMTLQEMRDNIEKEWTQRNRESDRRVDILLATAPPPRAPRRKSDTVDWASFAIGWCFGCFVVMVGFMAGFLL